MPPRSITAESWRDIPGWEGSYQASDHGRIRSLPRIVVRRNGSTQTVRGGVLVPRPGRGGYLVVDLKSPGRRRSVKVHKMVALAWLGATPPGMEVCHRNGNRVDNRPANLRHGTHSENIRDTVRHGTHSQTAKTHCPRGHLLAEPNLVPSHAQRGWRTCLACKRAHNRLRANPALNLRVAADRAYSELTREAIAA
ncbi:HNH endonuclease [Nocardia cyriacigeorgica]|uniref:NUMOD4 motif-containing HNH endonuclease n=1 Tax=Nocardia cyriacigeorgica TaxID=135487 RepID=UPI0018936E1E|nr:NUMOD4 motif-containing HNH endonuclease [Nocardia cyriacigeorgica]MBF6085135.1 HNH endonuclease [Nocardia cyriacigeorgica]